MGQLTTMAEKILTSHLYQSGDVLRTGDLMSLLRLKRGDHKTMRETVDTLVLSGQLEQVSGGYRKPCKHRELLRRKWDSSLQLGST